MRTHHPYPMLPASLAFQPDTTMGITIGNKKAPAANQGSKAK